VSPSLPDQTSAPQSQRPLVPAWEAESVQLTGYTLSVRSAPQPSPSTDADLEPAVMVHGLGGSALNWTDLMALLADRLATRAPDLPGFGFSPPPDDGDYSLAGHARAVVALIERDGRGPVHLFGNSLGGAVSVVVAATRPDLVLSLVLVSPALPNFRPGKWRTQVALLSVPGLGQLLSRRLGDLSPEQRVKGLLNLVYADASGIPPERLAEAAVEVERRATLPYAVDAMSASARGLVNSYLFTGPGAPWAMAGRITVPTLLIYGGQDKLVSSRVAQKAGAAFSDSTVVVLPNTGHVAQMEHPELVARFVRAHLDRG
jgi:pimeloyl-ACP methyl ester carboxylesterase